MNRQALLLVACLGAVLACRGRAPDRDSGGLKVRDVTPEQLPPDVRGALEDTARRQSVAANRANATIRRAYAYVAPRSMESVRLGYWGRDLTTRPFPIAGEGPSLPAPDSKVARD